MSRPRFSIASLLVLALFLAVALAGLRAATDLWDSAIFTATLGLLLVAVLLAIHRTERRRAFWLGFALFGWVGLVASMVPAIESRLATTKLLALVDSKIHPRPISVRLALDLAYTATSNKSGIVSAPIVPLPRYQRVTLGRLNGTPEAFIRIGHSLIALLLAYLGGHLSRFSYLGHRQPDSGEKREEESTSAT